MATRPPIQAVIEQAEFDESRRHWRMVLFNEDETPFTGGGGGAEEVADLALEAGWSNLGGGYEPVRRVKQGRLVTLAGIVKSIGPHSGDGSPGGGAVIGTLPEGWRPENTIICGGFGYFAGYAIRRWDIESNGNVVLQGPMSDTDWITLNATFLVPA